MSAGGVAVVAPGVAVPDGFSGVVVPVCVELVPVVPVWPMVPAVLLLPVWSVVVPDCAAPVEFTVPEELVLVDCGIMLAARRPSLA